MALFSPDFALVANRAPPFIVLTGPKAASVPSIAIALRQIHGEASPSSDHRRGFGKSAEIGDGKHDLRIVSMRGNTPRRAVGFAGQSDVFQLLPWSRERSSRPVEPGGPLPLVKKRF